MPLLINLIKLVPVIVNLLMQISAHNKKKDVQA